MTLQQQHHRPDYFVIKEEAAKSVHRAIMVREANCGLFYFFYSFYQFCSASILAATGLAALLCV
jgi:hypothetical protein